MHLLKIKSWAGIPHDLCIDDKRGQGCASTRFAFRDDVMLHEQTALVSARISLGIRLGEFHDVVRDLVQPVQIRYISTFALDRIGDPYGHRRARGLDVLACPVLQVLEGKLFAKPLGDNFPDLIEEPSHDAPTHIAMRRGQHQEREFVPSQAERHAIPMASMTLIPLLHQGSDDIRDEQNCMVSVRIRPMVVYVFEVVDIR
mmetsp:Transcript_53128/g.172748  ORF Transcript_53128/g.172748 Transcript_53128/m.172748 type:complete len:201 (+) Transcript_53128:256-858(+)